MCQGEPKDAKGIASCSQDHSQKQGLCKADLSVYRGFLCCKFTCSYSTWCSLGVQGPEFFLTEFYMPLVITTSCHLQESPVCVSSPCHWPKINLSDSHMKDIRAATKLGRGLEGCILIPSYFYSRNAFYCLASLKLFFQTVTAGSCCC